MATVLEYMKLSLNVYAASDKNAVGVPFGWNRTYWQPDLASGFSAGTFVKMTRKEKLKIVGLAFILVLTLTACGVGSEKWKEEVQLSDGKVIVIQRELLMANGGDELAVDNRSNFSPKEYHIQLSDPNDPSKTIKWHSIKKDTSTFPESPLILDILSGQVTIYTSLAVGPGCQMYSKYLYKDGVWVEEKLPPTFEQRVTNLYVYRGKDVQRFVDIKTKQEIVSKHYSADRSDRFDLVGPEHPNCKGV